MQWRSSQGESSEVPEALILAEGKYDTSDAKTAHGLVRKSMRYKIVGVIDSRFAGMDAGEVLDIINDAGAKLWGVFSVISISDDP